MTISVSAIVAPAMSPVSSDNARSVAWTANVLAAFAAGCTGLRTKALVGKRLGIMGGATADEFLSVLKHLELLHIQHVTKLAGSGGGAGTSAVSSIEMGKAKRSAVLGTRFEAELLKAVKTCTLVELFDQLPQDVNGRIDLCRIFDVTSSAPRAALDYPAEYVESAANLPHACGDVVNQAAELLLEEPDEERWEIESAAVNALRAATHAAVAKGSAARRGGEGPQALALQALARRCGSKRPALAKNALRALAEIAAAWPARDVAVEKIAGSRDCEEIPNAWSEASPEVLDACLDALKGTKLVAKVAEESLAVCTRRIVADSSPALAASLFVVSARVAVQPPRPPVVAGVLKALLPLASSMDYPGRDEPTAAALTEVKQLCEEVLACRALGACYAGARAVLRALPEPQLPEAGQS